ncbi:MAG: hypothetical protein GY828_03120 [Candidatus Gracilibacteria bacterium]|nr:hypothetical protein [Candidatus Gracilibacteria bacterium]
MKKADIYKNYLSKIEEALTQENFDNLDYILEFLNIPNIEEEVYNEISDIIDEVTLFVEFKESDYKNTALNMIVEYK